MNQALNPYAPSSHPSSSADADSNVDSAASVFVAWEKLRLLYNGLLVVLVVLVQYLQQLSRLE